MKIKRDIFKTYTEIKTRTKKIKVNKTRNETYNLNIITSHSFSGYPNLTKKEVHKILKKNNIKYVRLS